MKLIPLTLKDAQTARYWRNGCREALRTPFLLTEKQQEEFYNSLSGNARVRYWGIEINGEMGGMGGLTGIEWENRIAEISLIIDPVLRGKGYGTKAAELILHEGFGNMNLANIYGECYECNEAIRFWRKVCLKYGAYMTLLPFRKFWDGRYYGSLYFNIRGDTFGINGDPKHGDGRNGGQKPG